MTLKEGEKLRTVLLFLLFAHIVFLACEIFLYNTSIALIFSELFYCWLNYFAYQTMNSVALYLYIVVLGLACGLGVLQLLSVGAWFLIYLGQLAAYGYGAYELWNRMQAYSSAKTKKSMREEEKDDEEIGEKAVKAGPPQVEDFQKNMIN